MAALACLAHIEYISLALKEYYYETRAAVILTSNRSWYYSSGTTSRRAYRRRRVCGGDSEYSHSNIYYTYHMRVHM